MKMVNINTGKLRQAITEEMGLTIEEASEYIGYSQSYLSRVIQTGKAPYRVVKLIESQLGIGEDEILREEKEEKPTEDGLADAVAKAVYDAVLKALNSEDMNNAIYRGMRGALFEVEQKKAEKYFH